jgi:hypothetical protein
MESQDATLKVILESGAFPAFSRLFAQPDLDLDLDLDSMFELGLARLLDGLEELVRDAKKSRKHRRRRGSAQESRCRDVMSTGAAGQDVPRPPEPGSAHYPLGPASGRRTAAPGGIDP